MATLRPLSWLKIFVLKRAFKLDLSKLKVIQGDYVPRRMTLNKIYKIRAMKEQGFSYEIINKKYPVHRPIYDRILDPESIKVIYEDHVA